MKLSSSPDRGKEDALLLSRFHLSDQLLCLDVLDGHSLPFSAVVPF